MTQHEKWSKTVSGGWRRATLGPRQANMQREKQLETMAEAGAESVSMMCVGNTDMTALVLRHITTPHLFVAAAACRAWAAAVAALLPEIAPTFFAMGSDVFEDDEGWLSHSGLKMRQRRRRERRERRPTFIPVSETSMSKSKTRLGKDVALAGRWLEPHERARVSFSLAQTCEGPRSGCDQPTIGVVRYSPADGVLGTHSEGDGSGGGVRLQWLCSRKPSTELQEQLTLELQDGGLVVTEAAQGRETGSTALHRIPVPDGTKALAFAVEMSRAGLPVRIQGGRFEAPQRLAETIACWQATGRPQPNANCGFPCEGGRERERERGGEGEGEV